MKLSIIIPAHNEEKRISRTFASIHHIFEGDFEVIVVSNGSTDNTANVLEEAKKKYPYIIFMDFKEKLGKGGAILEGLKIAQGEIIGFLDADDAFDLEQVKVAIDNFSEEYDCFIASKWKNQKLFEIAEPFSRKIMSRGWNFLVKIILGLNFRDTQGGLKFLKRSAFEKIGNSFIGTGFEFDAELLWKLQKNHFKIKEIHIPNRFVQGSTFNTKYIPAMFLNMLKLRWLK